MIAEFVNRYGTARALVVVLCFCSVLSAIDPASNILRRLESVAPPEFDFLFSDTLLGSPGAVHATSKRLVVGDGNSTSSSFSRSGRVRSSPEESLPFRRRLNELVPTSRSEPTYLRNRFDIRERHSYLPGVVQRDVTRNTSGSSVGSPSMRALMVPQSKSNSNPLIPSPQPGEPKPSRAEPSSRPPLPGTTPSLVVTPAPSTTNTGNESKFSFRFMGEGQVDIYERDLQGKEMYLATQLLDPNAPAVVFQGENGAAVWQRVFEAMFARIANLEGIQEATSQGLLLKSLSRNSDLRIIGIEESDILVSLNDSPFPMPGTDALFSGLASDWAYLKIVRSGQTKELLMYRYED